MNNKGQSLVAFIVLLPVLFMLAGIIIDISTSYVKKKEVVSSVKNSIEYSFKSDLDNYKTEQVMFKILSSNIDDIESYNITINEDDVYVYVKTNINGVFSNLFKNPTNNIEVKYKGYMKDGKVIIERG